MPSLPPAICRTTRIVESLPVTICVAESAASLCNAAKVSARNAGTVQDNALPSTVLRKNWRRVCSVISFFIDTSSHLIFRRAHHQADGGANVHVVQFAARTEKVAQRLCLVVLERRLQQPVLKRGHHPVVAGTFIRCENFLQIDTSNVDPFFIGFR